MLVLKKLVIVKALSCNSCHEKYYLSYGKIRCGNLGSDCPNISQHSLYYLNISYFISSYLVIIIITTTTTTTTTTVFSFLRFFQRNGNAKNEEMQKRKETET